MGATEKRRWRFNGFFSVFMRASGVFDKLLNHSRYPEIPRNINIGVPLLYQVAIPA